MIKKLKKLFSVLGPGLITGAADDDPSGIGTYSQTGAQFGYNQLWAAPFSFPFMVVIQEMCGRIGLVTGKGLAVIAKENYVKPVLYISVFLLLIANVINIGADLGAMAAAAGLLIPIPFVFLLLGFTVLTLLFEIFIPYPTYAKFLKYLTLSLLAYIITAFILNENWGKIFIATVIPNFSFKKEYLLNIVAILGTTISPYLFFWQADEEVEEEIDKGKINSMGSSRPDVSKKDIKKMRADTLIGMFVSNLVMFFIIVVAATSLHNHGITNITTADQAARAILPFAGSFASLIFAAGIIGTGMLAVPILAGSAAYAIGESMEWKVGLGLKFRRAHGFYGVIAVATIIGVLVNFTPIKPFQMLYYTAIINGVVAPPLMVLLLFISNNKKIMKEHTNSIFSNVVGILITLFMTVAAGALLLTLFF